MPVLCSHSMSAIWSKLFVHISDYIYIILYDLLLLIIIRAPFLVLQMSFIRHLILFSNRFKLILLAIFRHIYDWAVVN